MQTKKYSEISYQELKTYTGIILYKNRSKEYLLNGQRHRTDGPAIEFVSGNKHWFLNGKRHRTDGPAIEYTDGDKSWYYQDQYIKVESQEEFEAYIKCLAFE